MRRTTPKTDMILPKTVPRMIVIRSKLNIHLLYNLRRKFATQMQISSTTTIPQAV